MTTQVKAADNMGQPMSTSSDTLVVKAAEVILKLGIIVLVVSNFRLILGTVQKHGFVLGRVVQHYRDLPHISRDLWEEFPFVSGILLQLVFITITYAIEWLLSRKKLPESTGMILHQINAHCAFAVPMGIVWNFINEPPTGAMLLLHATITWMKLIAYIRANEDYRLSSRRADVDSHTATLALVENLDPGDEHILYPQNVTLRNMFYYWFAPTLTYQIAFPKSPRIRIWKIVWILLGVGALFTFIAALVVVWVVWAFGSFGIQDLAKALATNKLPG
jgi:diacylglycerol O-acyltransferase-1